MKAVFADTLYWVAMARPGDSWTPAARAARDALGNVTLVTTDEVLVEFLTGLSRGGPAVRKGGVKMVRDILDDEDVEVVPQSREGFRRGMRRYEQRPDKTYSLTDCISMNAMDDRGIREVLTNDHHFEQEGYTVLIRRNNG